MDHWLTGHPWVVWIGVGALLAIAEMLSLDLVLLMFAVGAFFAALGAAIGVPLWVSVLIFAIISGLLLVTVRRPLMHKLHAGPTLPTGYSELIGTSAEVIQQVNRSDGRVEAQGDMWTARTRDESTVGVGQYVIILRIEGATLIVEAQER